MIFRALLLLILIATDVFAQNLPKEISVAADLWCPYTCEPGVREGILVDIVKEVFAQRGVVVRYKFLPWKRAKSETEKGLHNAILGAFKADAQGFVLPRNPILFGTNAFFTLSSSAWKYSGLDSLKSVSLGIIEGYTYGPEMDPYIKENSSSLRIQFATGADALRKNLKKLSENKVEVVLDEPRVVKYEWMALKNTSATIKKAGQYGNEGIWIAFSSRRSDSEDLALAFSEGLEKFEKNGGVKRVTERYVGAD